MGDRSSFRVTLLLTSLLLVSVVGTVLAQSGFSAAEGVRGGTLIYAIGSDAQTLNPSISTNVEALAVACKMYNGLIWLDRELVPQPELATSWEISPDGLQYTFHLREGVRWHDGTPFTSADVAYTFSEVLAKYNPRTSKAFANASSISAPDDHTVVVEFSRPYAPFLQQMTCQEAAILPKHLYEGTDPTSNPHNYDDPVGTGAFKFKEWVRGDRIVMVRNDDYFRDGLPYLDQIIAKVMPDPTSRVLGLLAGEVDYIQSFFMPKEEVPRLEGDPNVQMKFGTDLPGNYLMFLNVENQYLKNVGVRKALLVGLNRQQIVSQAFFGIGAPGESAIHRGLAWASNPDVSYTEMYGYDPERANAMLDELGYERGANGVRFQIRLIYVPAQPGMSSLAQIARDNWRQIGVDVVLEPFEDQVVTDRVFNKRDFDTYIIGYTTSGDPAIGVTRAYMTVPIGKSFTNPTNYSNPEVDDLFNAAASTPFREERQKAYYAAQEIIAEDLPVFNVIDRTEVDVAATGLHGLWVSSQPYDLWDRVWWEGGGN